MPQLAQALSGALPEAALRQLMQALGNCQQPLTHRGSVNLAPSTTTGVGALQKTGTWNQSKYQNLFPSAGSQGYVDTPGKGGSSTTNNVSNSYGGSTFNFPMNQAFNYSSYYGGETFTVLGNTNFQNITTQNISVTQGGGGVSFGNTGQGSFAQVQQDPRGGIGFNPGGGGGDGGDGGGFYPGGAGSGLTIVFPNRPGFPGMPGGAGWPRFNPMGGGGFVGGNAWRATTNRNQPQTPTSYKGTLGGSTQTQVTVTGNVSVPTVTGGFLDDNCNITLTPGTTNVPVTLSGFVPVPSSVTITPA